MDGMSHEAPLGPALAPEMSATPWPAPNGFLEERLTKNTPATGAAGVSMLRFMLRSISAVSCWFLDHFSLVKMIVPEAANMPPTPWQTLILAPSTWAGAMPRICRTLSCRAYMPYIPECM